jgi:DNA-directed RNA polymerase subunit RPC12/RpoP
MSEYESGTFRCMDCAKEFLTKDEADRHYIEYHSDVTLGE